MEAFDLKDSLNSVYIQLYIFTDHEFTAIRGKPTYRIGVDGCLPVCERDFIGGSGWDGVTFNRLAPFGFAFMPVSVIVLVSIGGYAVR